MTYCPVPSLPYGEALLRAQMPTRPGMELLDQALARGVTVPVYLANGPGDVARGFDAHGGDPLYGSRPGTLTPKTTRMPSEVGIPIGASFIDGDWHERTKWLAEKTGFTGTRFAVNANEYPKRGVQALVPFANVPGVMDVVETMSARERQPSEGVRVSLPPLLTFPVVGGESGGMRAPLPRPQLPGTPRHFGPAQHGALVMGQVNTNSTRTPGMSARPANDVRSGTTLAGGVMSPFAPVASRGGSVPYERSVGALPTGRAEIHDPEAGLERALVINTWVWTGIGALTLAGLFLRRRRR